MFEFLRLQTPCFYMPKLCCSFGPAITHPLLGKLQEDFDEWILGMANAKSAEEKKSIGGEKLVLGTCSLFPKAVDSTMVNLVRYCSWFSLFDSCADDMTLHGINHKVTLLLVGRYTNVINDIESGSGSASLEGLGTGLIGKIGGGIKKVLDHHGSDSEGILLSHFEYLWQELRKDMSPTLFKRLSESVMEMFNTSSHQNMRREKGMKFTTIEELLDHRKLLTTSVLNILLEYSLGIELDEGVRNLPEVVEIKKIANEHICCVNDMLSFRAEYHRNDFHNLPSTISLLENVSIQEAVVETCELIKSLDEKFVKLHSSITGSGTSCSPQLKAFVDGLGYMMAGKLEWAWQTGRYHGADWNAPAPEERQGIMYLAQAKTCTVFKPCLV